MYLGRENCASSMYKEDTVHDSSSRMPILYGQSHSYNVYIYLLNTYNYRYVENKPSLKSINSV